MVESALTFMPSARTWLFVANHAKELTAPVAATSAVAALRPSMVSFLEFFMMQKSLPGVLPFFHGGPPREGPGGLGPQGGGSRRCLEVEARSRRAPPCLSQRSSESEGERRFFPVFGLFLRKRPPCFFATPSKTFILSVIKAKPRRLGDAKPKGLTLDSLVAASEKR